MTTEIFNFDTHTTEGLPTSQYMDWCQALYIRMGAYDSDELREAKRRLAINEAYKLLKIMDNIEINTHIFLTINPPPLISFGSFKLIMEKLMKKKWIESSLYVYEQRSETLEDLGKGFHFHALIVKPVNKPTFQIQREMKNSCKNIVDVENHHFFNLKFIPYDEALRKKIYILGDKKDTNKHKKQEMDKHFRNRENILPFYNNNYNIE